MSRIRLKCGGNRKRKKALLGADGAVMAAATLTAAGMNVAATIKAAKEQSNAMIQNAKTQADVLRQQNENNTNLQKENIEFTRQQNQESRQQQQDIQMTLQMLAGKENMNDRMERNKMQVKYGGRRKLKKGGWSSSPSYGGVRVTDGGGLIPVNTDVNGYGTYIAFGDDHDEYHKTSSGKYKTGVGLKLPNGEDLEIEGGEGLTIYPDEVTAYSKHKVGDFVPVDALLAGVPEEQVAAKQEFNKAVLGYNDDGTKAKCGGRRKLKAMMGIFNPINNSTSIINSNNFNNTAIGSGITYLIDKNENDSPIAKCGKRVSLRKKADYGGAILNAAGNIGGAALSWIGNSIAGNTLSKAYAQAGDILANAYNNFKTIDMDMISSSDFESSSNPMAAIRSANYKNNAARERVRRNAAYAINDTNRNTMSSAARQQRNAATADRYYDRIGELSEQEQNINEEIRQGNMQRITDVSSEAAKIKAQARKDYTNARLSLAQYNNDIENQRLAGAAQARADAITQGAGARSTALIEGMTGMGNAIASSGNAFATAYDDNKKFKQDYISSHVGLGNEKQVTSSLSFYDLTGDYTLAKTQWDRAYGKDDPVSRATIRTITNHFGGNIPWLNNTNNTI